MSGAFGPGRPRDRHTRACGSEWSISKPARALRALRHPPRWLSMVLVFGRRALVGRGSSWWLGVVPECRVPSGPAAREIATREPAARSGRSRSPPVPSGPYGTRHAGCPWCWSPVKPCRTKTQVFGLSRRDAIQTKGPGGRQSSRARCVTQGSDRYSPSTGASAATSTASPDTVPPAPVSPPASWSAATRPPATKSTISAHSRANDESSSASAA